MRKITNERISLPNLKKLIHLKILKEETADLVARA